jgi:hypothetical protein
VKQVLGSVAHHLPVSNDLLGDKFSACDLPQRWPVVVRTVVEPDGPVDGHDAFWQSLYVEKMRIDDEELCSVR